MLSRWGGYVCVLCGESVVFSCVEHREGLVRFTWLGWRACLHPALTMCVYMRCDTCDTELSAPKEAAMFGLALCAFTTSKRLERHSLMLPLPSSTHISPPSSRRCSLHSPGASELRLSTEHALLPARACGECAANPGLIHYVSFVETDYVLSVRHGNCTMHPHHHAVDINAPFPPLHTQQTPSTTLYHIPAHSITHHHTYTPNPFTHQPGRLMHHMVPVTLFWGATCAQCSKRIGGFFPAADQCSRCLTIVGRAGVSAVCMHVRLKIMHAVFMHVMLKIIRAVCMHVMLMSRVLVYCSFGYIVHHSVCA